MAADETGQLGPLNSVVKQGPVDETAKEELPNWGQPAP